MPEQVIEIWSDLSEKLVADSQGGLKKNINIEAVKTSINNILGTHRGERVFLPQFASSLRDLIFEPISESLINKIADEVKNKVEIWDNRVSVTGVDIKVDPDNNYIEITTKFNIKSYTESFSQTTVITQ